MKKFLFALALFASTGAFAQVQQDVIAILPVTFINKETGQVSEENSKMAQSRIYDFLQDKPAKIAPLTLQDSRTTNSKLRKSNITYKELDEIGIDELQQIVGAEYMVLSKVTYITKHGTSSSSGSSNNRKTDNNKSNSSTYSSSSTTETMTYEYVVSLEIYKGTQKIYNETRTPMLNTVDSWKDAYEYMLKRTPIYKRK